MRYSDAMPNVSIIIPCYNAEKFLDETLTGLENQTSRDFEVVCINDGSKDSTLSILKRWQKKGTLDIRIVDKENAGVSAARNDGLKVAKGKYITFLDADDAYHEKFVEYLSTGVLQSNADVAYCRLDRKYENVVNADIKSTTYILHSQKEAMNNLLYRMGEFGFYCYIYKKELLENIALKFDIDTKFGEDREFIWKYLCHCDNAIFIDAPLYWYRINELSATKSKASWRKTDHLRAVKRTEKYFKENNCEYLNEYKSYMYARVMWGVAKTFAVHRDKNLYSRLMKEYDVKSCMKRTAKDKNMMVVLASICYLINPMLFFYIVRLKK